MKKVLFGLVVGISIDTAPKVLPAYAVDIHKFDGGKRPLVCKARKGVIYD
jgi:hypothetical protein